MASNGQACTDMLGLGEQCLHPSTGKPYIKSASGGKDNSPEGAQVSRSMLILLKSAPETQYPRTQYPILRFEQLFDLALLG